MKKFQLYCSCALCKASITVQNLTSHYRAHHEPKPTKVCLECGEDFVPKDKAQKFCSQSCSATHNNKDRPKKTYICETCGKESPVSHRHSNKFCSIECSSKGRINKTIERFNLGEVSERPTIRKILSKLRGYRCECCGIGSWQGKKLTLQVDHIDGNAGNNMPENLRLICPNCHSQTDSFSGGNKGNGRGSRGLPMN